MPTNYEKRAQIDLLNLQRDQIRKEIEEIESVLKANGVGMKEKLVDEEGFPRNDIDVYAVRNARVRLIELGNDHKRLTEELHLALITLHQQQQHSSVHKENYYGISRTGVDASKQEDFIKPFAKVDAIAPDSPADKAGLKRGDLLVQFGEVRSFAEIATHVLSHENVSLVNLLEICNQDEDEHFGQSGARSNRLIRNYRITSNAAEMERSRSVGLSYSAVLRR